MLALPKEGAARLRVGCLLLTLSAAPVLLPGAAARAQAPKVILATAPAPPAPADDGDGDGDELLEHWGDPRYTHEQRVQMVGLGVFLAGAGLLSYRRRAALRRISRHA